MPVLRHASHETRGKRSQRNKSRKRRLNATTTRHTTSRMHVYRLSLSLSHQDNTPASYVCESKAVI